MAPSFPSAFRHTWSLAIEEQFYLVWPALIWWVGKSRLALVSIALVVLAAVARSLNLSAFILVTHGDGLVLGGMLAGLFESQQRDSAEHWRRFAFRLYALGLCSSILYLGAIVLPRLVELTWPRLIAPALIYTFKPLFLNSMLVALVGTIVMHAGDRRLRWLRSEGLVYLGTISYGIYLYHHFIFELCKYYEVYFGMRDNLFLDVAKLVASIGVAAFSWKYIERPILSLKDRFRYRDGVKAGLAVHNDVDEIRGMQPG